MGKERLAWNSLDLLRKKHTIDYTRDIVTSASLREFNRTLSFNRRLQAFIQSTAHSQMDHGSLYRFRLLASTLYNSFSLH
jgi:hypothetical protein